ncbi:methyltransferase [Glutamicibacter endophyticus]
MSTVLDSLRRWPDVEAENLHAVDAADRLILDTVQQWPDTVAVLGDHYGALTLGALEAGAERVVVHTDALTARRAIAANLERLRPDWLMRVDFRDPEDTVRGAELVLLPLPRGLDVLQEYAHLIASLASAEVVVHAGGRIKHMNLSMNEVLATMFERVDVSLARQKSRVLSCRTPRSELPEPQYPQHRTHRVGDTQFTLIAGAQTFGQARLDPGTRLLLEQLPDLGDEPRLLDLACGNGSIGIVAALRYPGLEVTASDHSAAAVHATRAGAAANGLAARIEARQDDALSSWPDASASLITLNPPFHMGNTVHAGIALKLIDDAARVLRDGGRLICVYNSHLRYRTELSRRVGPTQQLARNEKFTLTVSTRRR